MRYQLLRRSGWLYCLFLMVSAGATFLFPPAAASHIAELSSICYDCHTLNADLGDPVTSFINESARNLNMLRTQNAGATPTSFACTFCHNDPIRTTEMFDALGDFGSQTSMHFVGRTFPSAGEVPSFNMYVSNQTGTDYYAAPIPNELQCVYCHNVQNAAEPLPGDFGYPNHPVLDPVNNPKRLMNVNAPADYPFNFCVTTCHDGDYTDSTGVAPGPNLPDGYNIDPMGHYGYGGFDGTTIYENRGTAMKTSACDVCHDTHSSNKDDLFSDGTDNVYGTTTAETAINEASCTADCHPGDGAASEFRTAGHGKPMNREGTIPINHSYTMCTPCHTSGVSHRELANPKRFAFAEDTNMSGMSNDGSANGLDDDYDGLVDEADEGSWTQPLESICQGCHFDYNGHSGAITGGSGLGSSSCLDCHDPHGKGTGANIEMVRTVIAGEVTTYETAVDMGAPDYFRVDTTGVCDNETCHGVPLGDDATPGTILGDFADHQGVVPGTDCISCHTHSGTGPSFQPACGSCHGYPPSDSDSYADNTNGAGVHDTHVTTLGYDCVECHYRDGGAENGHNESTWSSNQGIPVPRLQVDVVFDTHGGTVNTTASYSDYGAGGDMTLGPTYTCNNVTCHNPDNTVIGLTPKGNVATDVIHNEQWLTGFTAINTCTGCHVESPAADPEGGSHNRHDNSAELGYACETCHNGYFAGPSHADLFLDTGTTDRYPAGAPDGTDEALVNIGGTLGGVTLSGNWTDGLAWQGTCDTLYCHGGGAPFPGVNGTAGEDNTPDWGNAATAECGDCHQTDPVSNPGGGYVDSGAHTTHVDDTAAPYGPLGTGCTVCHTDATDPQHVDGYVNFADLNTAAATTACDTCHNGSPASAKSYWTNAGGAGTWLADGTYCQHCHDVSNSIIGAVPAPDVIGDDATYGAAVTGHSAANPYESLNPGANKACVVCHDATAVPHIDGALGDLFADQRLLGTISLNAVTTVEQACDACHQPAIPLGADEATIKASRHGNDYPDAVEGAPGSMPAQGCGVCHEVHGVVAGGGDVNWWMIRYALTTPNNGVQSVQLTGSSGPNSFDEVDATNAANLDDLCATCHLDAGPTGSTLTNHTTEPAGGGIHENNSVYYGDERGRDCTLCHSHDRDAAFATEDGFMPYSCDGCHGNPPATGAHPRHVTDYGFTCDLCHDYGVGPSRHNESGVANLAEYVATGVALIRQSVDIGFADYDPQGLALTYNQNGLYSIPKGPARGAADGVCNNLYCHGADAPFPATRPSIDDAPVWSTGLPVGAELPGAAACGVACHGQLSTNPPDSNAHIMHTSGDNAVDKGYGLTCNICHLDTTADGSAIFFSAPQTTLHVNTQADVDFDGADPRLETTLAPVSAYGGTPAVGDAGSDAFDACANTYCHSPGNDTVAPFTENPLGGPRQWNLVGANCTACHGQGPGYPDTSPKANKHAKHVTENAYTACETCHRSTRTELNNETYGTFHVNMAYDVDADPANTPLGDFTYTGGAAGSCTTVNCHGGNDVDWNYDVAGLGHFTCDVCHGQSGGTPVGVADVDDFSFQDWSQSKVSSEAAVGEYVTVGHGAILGGSDTGTPVQCADCHDSGTFHDASGGLPNALPGANPFRLRGSFTCANVTVGCHNGAQSSIVVTHSSGEMATAGYTTQVNSWGFTPKCVDCHDPHGDEANLHMVQEDLWDNGSAANRVPTSYGAIGNPNLVFEDDGSGVETAAPYDSYADTFNFSSICQECHETPDSDLESFRDDTTAAVLPHPFGGGNPGDCTPCHPHDEAFAPSGCYGCHGNSGTKQAWPDGSGGFPAYADDAAGAHDAHVETISQYLFGMNIATLLGQPDTTDRQKQTCVFCHPDPGGLGHYNEVIVDSRVDVLWDGDNDIVGTYFQVFEVGAQVYGDDHNDDALYTRAVPGGTCSDLTCHNEQPTPNWETYAGTPDCFLCHPDGIGTAAHPRHTATIEKDYDCAECHANNGIYPTSTITAEIRHQDGDVDMDFNTLGTIEQNPGGGDGAYAKGTGFAYKDSNYAQACVNVYCHGDDNPGAAPGWAGSYTEPLWDDLTATIACGTCHDTDLADTTGGTLIATSQHPTHLTAGYGPTATCGDCHTGEAAATHVDGVKTFTGPNNLTGTTACNTCHNGSQNQAKIEWPLATGNWLAVTGGYCEHCHDSTFSTVGIPAPNMMGDNSSYGAAVTGHNAAGAYESLIPGAAKTCDTCHDPTAVPHINGSDDSGFGFARIISGSTINVLPFPLATTEELCSDCHQNTGGGHDAANQVSRHGNSYGTPIEGAMVPPVDCSTCHEVHGLVNGGGDVNWWMFRYSLATPNNGNQNVQLTGRTGPNSFDEDDTLNANQLDDACATCHMNNGATGSTMANHTTEPAGGALHESAAYTSDHRGDDCAGCHPHNLGGVAGTADGFMPLNCSDCHAFPPPTLAHDVHVTTYGIDCGRCHFGAPHNETGVVDAAGYAAAFPVAIHSNVQVAFDPNGFNSDANNGTLVGAGFATMGATADLTTCSNLACHNPDNAVTNKVLAADETSNVPVWGTLIVDGDCAACHGVNASGDPGGSDHQVHDSTYGFACMTCHSDVDLGLGAPGRATHGDLLVTTNPDNVVSIAGTLGSVDLALSTPVYTPAAGECAAVYCHGDTAAVSDGTDTTPIWGSAGTAACGDCHGADDNSTVDTWPTTNAHVKHAGSGATDLDRECAVCHDNFPVGHVDGLAQVAFDATTQSWSLVAPSYDGDMTVGSGFGITGCDNVYCHSDVVDLLPGPPDGFSDAYTQVVWNAGAQACGSCHGALGVSAPHTLHATSSPAGQGYACVVCHDTYGDDTVFHADHLVQNSFADTEWTIDLTSGGNPAYVYSGGTAVFLDALGSCDSLYCHGDFAGGDAANSQSWSGSAVCGSCHNAAAATPPPSFAHPQHTGNDLTAPAEQQYSFGCNLCHVSVTSDGTNITGRALHVNALANVNFDTSDGRLDGTTTYPASTTVGDAGSVATDICTNLYCHGGGALFPALNGGTDTTPEWSDAATADCGDCHGYTPAAPTRSNTHVIHAGNTAQAPQGYSLACSTCHVATTADNTTVADVTIHADGLADVNFDNGDSRVSAAPSPAPVSSYSAGASSTVGATYGQCDNTYCHSPGTDRTKPFEEPPNLGRAWNLSGANCGICHSVPPSYVDGVNIDGSAKANKHVDHNDNSYVDCHTCHYDTAYPDNFTISDPGGFAVHVNYAYTVVPNTADNGALNDFTFAAGGGGRNGSCSTVNCHGGNNVVWSDAGPITCDICHTQSAGSPAGVADTNNFQMRDWTQSKISDDGAGSDEYGSAGHGGKGLACAACHNSAFTHDTTGPFPNSLPGINPFRLSAGFTCSDPSAGCHPAGTIGPATGKDISTFITHDDSVMPSTIPRTWPAWNPECVNCHDPHGDQASAAVSGNLSMIQRELYDKASFSLPAGPPPAAPTEQTDLEFTDDATGASAANDSYAYLAAGWSGICQECHEAGDHLSFVDDTSPAIETDHPGTDASPPGDCSLCHPHEDGFSASGCNGCHGDLIGGQYWPDGAGGLPAYVDDLGTDGSHDNHVMVIGQYLGYGDYTVIMYDDVQQKAICAFCHPDPGGSGHTADNGAGVYASRVDVWFDTQNDGGGAGNNFQAFKVGANATGDDAGTANASYDTNTLSCSNLDCHNESQTPTGANDWDSPPASPNCSLCHPDGTGTGAHGIHTASAQKAYDCTECHGNNGTYPTSTITAQIRHQEGEVDMEFTTAGTLELVSGGGDGSYAKGTAFTYKNGNYAQACAAIYCHGADDPWGGADTTPEWNNTPAIGCGDCHDGNGIDGDTSTIATTSHPTHFNSTIGPSLAPPAACAVCHSGYTVTDATHVNGTKNLITRNEAPAVTTATDLTGTEVCNPCHGITTYNTETIKTTWSNATGNTYAPPGPTVDVTCESCHGGGDRRAWQNADATGTQAPDKDTTDSVSGHGSFTVYCVDCHDEAAGHIDGTAGNVTRVVQTAPYTTFCQYCHDNADDGSGAAESVNDVAATMASVHGNTSPLYVPPNPPAEGAFATDCEDCHDPHGTTNIKMVNTLINASAVTYANDTQYDTGAATSVCRVCHNPGNLEHVGEFAALPSLHGTDFRNTNQCRGCHQHEFDGDETTADAFMPDQCNACHAYPGLDDIVSTEHQLSAVHTMHAGAPTSTGDTNYGFGCTTCHLNYAHNESNYVKGVSTWTAVVVNADISVRFDPAVNPNNVTTPSYGGQDASTATAPGANGTGQCAGLYCHGNNGDNAVAAGQSDWAGLNETPNWAIADPARLGCDDCHNDPPASGAHELHTVDSGAADRTDCVRCHTGVDYDTVPITANTASIHLDGTFGPEAAGAAYTGQTAFIPPDGYCTNACHASSATNGRWDDTLLACDSCHYYNVAGDATSVGNSASFYTLTSPSHNGHFDASGRIFACVDCHTDNSADNVPGPGLTHFTVGAPANDLAEIVDKAEPTQAEATITDTTWITVAADWTPGTKTCTNMCHDPSAAGTYSAVWGGTNAACNFCHSTSDPATGQHTSHMGSQPTYGHNIQCADCHIDNAGSPDHMTGTVDLSSLTALTYSGTPAAPYGDVFGTCDTTDCHQDGRGTTVPTETWGSGTNPVGGCAYCHAATPVTDSHTTHLSAAYGPGIGTDCGDCHDANANNTSMTARTNHFNGNITFNDANEVATGGIGADGAVTSCNTCHGDAAGGTSAKTYWTSVAGQWLTDGGYCEHCHDASQSVVSTTAGTGGVNMTAPTMTTYYTAADGGHGGVAPVQGCDDCHNQAGAHIDGTAGNEDRIVQATVSTFCQYCHDNDGADDAVGGESVTEVGATYASRHSNADAGYTPPNPPAENAFTEECLTCHDPHGTSNIKMVNTTINAVPGVNFTVDTRFDTGAASDVCRVCHTVDVNPGNLNAVEHVGEAGGFHAQSFQGTNQCRGCHQHEYDADVSTDDGFMPLECNACHTYPGLATQGGTVRLTAVHDVHVGVPSDEGAVNNKGFACVQCHNGADHNSGTGGAITDPTQWAAQVAPNIDNRVQVRFDSWNPVAAGNNPGSTALDSTSFADGTNVCSNLYCHGDAFVVAAAGTDMTPDWDDTTTADCGDCHSDTNPVSNSHNAHLTTTTSASADGIDCADCHTAYDLASAGSHVNQVVTFAGVTYTGDTSDKDNSALLGSCNTNSCHNDGKNAGPRTAYTWGTAIGAVGSCTECHGDDAASHTTEAHDPHITYRSTIGATLCSGCHDAATAVTHSDGTVDVAGGAANYAGTVVVGDAGFGSCTTGACHDIGTDIDWDVSATDCNECHQDTNDRNDFNGRDSLASEVDSADFSGAGHGVKSIACMDCHNIGQAHDFSNPIAGANPYRLNVGFTCTDNAANCHDGTPTASVATVVSHTSTEMVNGGYTPQVDSWSFDPKCVDCHDPHGDGANLHMIQTDLWEGSSTTNDWGIPTVYPPENTSLVFTDDTTGADAGGASYADTNATFSSICQECHETVDVDMTSFLDGTTGSGVGHPTPGGNPGDCSSCHKHDTGFMPSGCEDCHDSSGPGPNVMGDGNDPDGTGATPKPYDNGTWGFNVNGHGANGTAGSTPAGLTPNADCTDCHDTSDPSPNTHNDLVLNSHSTGNINSNTYHLTSNFIFSGVPTNEYDVQVTFDNACWDACHDGSGVNFMDHDSDNDDGVPEPPGPAEFGLHLTYPDGDGELHTHGYLNAPWPADSDVRDWTGRTTEPDYAICASCHDPHGTTIDQVVEGENTNRMLRETWKSNNNLCLVCHW